MAEYTIVFLFLTHSATTSTHTWTVSFTAETRNFTVIVIHLNSKKYFCQHCWQSLLLFSGAHTLSGVLGKSISKRNVKQRQSDYVQREQNIHSLLLGTVNCKLIINSETFGIQFYYGQCINIDILLDSTTGQPIISLLCFGPGH